MRSMILAAATALPLAFASVGAEAMPAGAVVAPAAPEVMLVAGGCGPGFHLSPYGCVRNFRRPAYVYAPRVYAPVYRRPWARCGIRVGPIGIGAPC